MEIAGVEPAAVAEVERETSELLSRLIRIDTSNPPGNETAVAEFMAAWFREAGLHGEVAGEPADRRSFVLRLEGQRPGPSLLLLAHEDVVPANAADWQVPPFSGLIKDGYVWGRGAVDIKNLVAANAVAVKRLAAAGAPFAGTVVYACTADEEGPQEEGALDGARWLTVHRPDLVRCDYVLNEGDGAVIERGGRHLFIVQSGEKGTARFRITVHGTAGHGAVPLRGTNAVLAAARVVEALAVAELPLVVEAAPAGLVAALVDDPELRARLREPGKARAALRKLAASDVELADMIEPLYGFAFAPTVVHSDGDAVNVYPGRVEIGVDCRPLADHGEDEVEAEVKRALAGVDADWELAWTSLIRGNASPYPSPLSNAIEKVLRRKVPDAELVNSHCIGFTDSHWLRVAFPDVIAYNFDPHVGERYADVLPRAHGVDERVLIHDLAYQVLFAEGVAMELLR